ncbi:MAG: ArsR/SmtB family transcription factor [Gaiellaceae bacterium]
MKKLALIDACCLPGAAPIDDATASDLAASFKALADPTRVAIVNRLAAEGECCVCHFVEESVLSQPTVSHHLRVLRDAGLVEAERRGTWAYYRLNSDAIGRLASALGGARSAASAPAAALHPRR